MLDVIICANFSVEKLRSLGNTRGQILEFPIEIGWSPLQQGWRYRAACDMFVVGLRFPVVCSRLFDWLMTTVWQVG